MGNVRAVKAAPKIPCVRLGAARDIDREYVQNATHATSMAAYWHLP
jgi:hypothetical protein